MNRLLLMTNFCTFKNISIFRVFVKYVEPNNNKSVFKLICKSMVWIYLYMNIDHTSVAIQNLPTWLDEQKSPDSHIIRCSAVLAISQDWKLPYILIEWLISLITVCLINLGRQSNCITVLTNYCIGYTT